MKNTLPIFITGLAVLCAFGSRVYAADEALDPTRPGLQNVAPGEKFRINEFYFPFLVCETGTVVPGSVAAVSERLKALLEKTALPIKGHYSKSGLAVSKLTTEQFPLPKPVTTGDQQKGLNNCTKDFCIMKLQNEKEKPRVVAGKNRMEVFNQIIVDRVKAFVEQNELTGYDARATNRDSVSKMLKKLSYFPLVYPKCNQFLEHDFWDNVKTEGCKINDSFIRNDILILADSILQPIMRVSEVFDLEENGNHLFFEVHIYTNHYFDSSGRVFEVLPWKKSSDKSVVVITDLMEIDELTKSSVVRFLYQGKIENAVTNNQTKELVKLK
jgi:hypothetical protein